MAFTLENLSIATNNMKAGVKPSVWTYYNEDNDAVTAANFFAEARLTVGDLIGVDSGKATSPVIYRVSAKSTDGFTATAIELAAQQNNAQPVDLITFVAQLGVDVSPDVLLTQVVTSAADTASTFTTSATAGSFITLTKDVVDGIYFVLTTVTTLPAGLSLATAYYSVNSDGVKCQLSLTHGGEPVAITSAGTGAHTATAQSNQVMLRDGVEGQRKIIKIKTDGGTDCVIAADTLQDGGKATGADALDSMALIFSDGSWQVLDNTGYTIAAYTET